MPFVPPSSLAPTTVTVLGTVAVSNFPADQLVHFGQPVAVNVATMPESVTDSLDEIGLTAILQRERMETE
jgi:hypothetical protein